MTYSVNTKHSSIMSKTELTKKRKIILFCLLIILNLILRIPSIPHEKGGDSFAMHAYANSITRLGTVEWWINWLAVFGLHPSTYASAVPVSLSGLSQLTGLNGIEMEYTLLLFSVVLGLISIFTAYSLAGTISDNFLFKYFLSLIFSTAPGVMIFSTWEISTRGIYIIFLPLFIFILFKNMHYSKKILILIIMGIFIAASHHFFFFLIPLLVVYSFMKILLKCLPKLNEKKSLNYFYLVCLIIFLIYPFLTSSMIEAGSRYVWITDMIKINIRYIGPTIILFVGGLIYLILKEGKKFEEWYFLLGFLVLSPIFYNQLYGAYVILIFPIIFISTAFKNMIGQKINKDIIAPIIVIMIISSITFSAYYNHFRTSEDVKSWYMSEEDYMTAKWGNNYISEGQISLGGLSLSYARITAVSDGHIAQPQTKISEIETIDVSPTSMDYYFEGPKVMKPGTSMSGNVNWLLDLDNVDDTPAQAIIKYLGAKYFVRDSAYDTKLGVSIENKRDRLYDSGKINIFLL